MRSLILLMAFVASLWAIDTGSLSFYLMKDGKPMVNQQVVIFKKSASPMFEMPSSYNRHAEFVTDEDGYLNTVLPVGDYQLQVVAKEKETAQAFVKKPFAVQKNKESQIIVSLKEDDTVSFEDSEAPKEQVAVAEDQNLTDKQEGTLLITLVSSEDSSSIKDARVFVQGHSVDVTTNDKGEVSLSLLEGEHTVSIIHSNYSSQTLKITVVANETVKKSYEMSPAAMSLEEFVVLAPRVEGSISSAIDEKRNDVSVSEVLGAEQMAKSGDSKASDALKRVAGVTLKDGKYVLIRGLGDRYTTVTMNNFTLPSPNPTQRVVPLDIFPASVLESIKVQKAFTPDKPGEMTGGLVDLKTKNVPDDFFLKLSASVKYVDGTTFEDGNTYKGGSFDAIGYDDGTRALPADLVNNQLVESLVPGVTPGYSKDQITDISKQLTYDNDVKSETMPLGMKVGISLGDAYDFDSENTVGFIAAASFKNDNRKINLEQNQVRNGATGTETYIEKDSIVDKYTKSLSAMFGLGWKGGDDHKIDATTLYVHQANDVVKVGNKLNKTDTLQPIESIQTDLVWTETALWMNQLAGSHKIDLGINTKLQWRTGYSFANLYEPDRRAYEFVYNETQDQYLLSGDDTTRFKRDWTKVEDEVFEAGGDYLMEIPLWNDMQADVKVGTTYISKLRTSYLRKFSYSRLDQNSRPLEPFEQSENIDPIINEATLGGTTVDAPYLLLEIPGRNTSAYNGFHELFAMYAMANVKFTDWLDVTAGVRYDASNMQVDIIDNVTGEAFPEDTAYVDDSIYLPSFVANVKTAEDSQLRLAAAYTVARPNFTELAYVSLVDPLTGDISYGNPNLVPTTVLNLDMRWEWYFAPAESFSVGVFYKDFEKPIEKVQAPISGGGRAFTYANAAGATTSGLELDFRKLIFTDDYFVAGNFTLVESEIDLGDDQGIQTNQSRQMQGQSPYIANLQVGYDSQDTGSTASLILNAYGKRIAVVGAYGFEDEYEQAYQQLDFVSIYRYNDDLKLQFKIENILNPAREIKMGDITTYSYKRGTGYTFGASYAF